MKVQIKRVRLVHPAPIGRSAVVESHLGYDSRVDDAPISLAFDKDARFIRMEIVGKEYFELIPISNVATMLCEAVA